ncbi:MAG: PaaX family transcriptional regulator C-terminal domain-containing protein [Verrucomicrobiae bacterium]|nr:PaaX family transcriptional regulator C-terminal domain-containing protein [Verrucomicrobiae bacterium]
MKQLIEAEGIPECFCGFAAQELFLCSNAEIVAAAWDFESIGRAQRAYEQNPAVSPANLDKITSLSTLAEAVWIEHKAYKKAFFLDPLLPYALWPEGYHGQAVCHRHEQFRRCLARRLAQLIDE